MEQAGGGVEGMLDVRAMGDDSIVVVDKEDGGANSAWPPWKHLLEASLPPSCLYLPRQSGKKSTFPRTSLHLRVPHPLPLLHNSIHPSPRASMLLGTVHPTLHLT